MTSAVRMLPYKGHLLVLHAVSPAFVLTEGKLPGSPSLVQTQSLAIPRHRLFLH